MIRVLTMIAVAGFVLSVGCLSAAVAIGGPDAIARGSWGLVDDGDWHWGWSDHRHRGDPHGRWDDASSGPAGTRTLPWSTSQRLDLELAADVRYVQDSAATVELSGPKEALDHVVIEGGTIRYDREFRRYRWGGPKLSITVRAPNINTFELSGQNHLDIVGYRQNQLRLDVSGDGEATVSGETDELNLDISGSGEADLSGLKAKGADVDISGAADATIAPTEWAKVDVTGRGDVTITTNPKRLETDISGAGKVRQGDVS